MVNDILPIYSFKLKNLRRLVCGHWNCASCLRDYFRQKLRDRIGRHRRGYLITARKMFKEGVPVDKFGQWMLSETLFPVQRLRKRKDYGPLSLRRRACEMEKLFSYPCPLCRQPQTKVPVTFPVLNRLLRRLDERLEWSGGEGVQDKVVPKDNTSIHFDGLFIDRK